MLNALRLTAGFDSRLYPLRTGRPLESVVPLLSSLEVEGLLESAGGSWRATSVGRQFLNEIIARFLPEAISQTVAGS
jgi:oxygen-independent coproporphyrinogen-3 oxidase